MRTRRIFVPQELDRRRTIDLNGPQANHVVRVLRLTTGDTLHLFDGTGGEYDARIVALRRGLVTVELDAHRDTDIESGLELVLVQGISQAQRMDFTIQKATELGVSRIVPVITNRSVARPGGERASRRLRHWVAVAASACEQCGRNRLPPIDEPCLLSEFFAHKPPASMHIVLSSTAGRGASELGFSGSSLCYLVGPEGGFTPEENNEAEMAGFVPIRLGPRIMRTETAAIAFASIAQSLWGDF